MTASLETTTTLKETFAEKVEEVLHDAGEALKHLAHEAVDDVENLFKREHSGNGEHAEGASGSLDNAPTEPPAADPAQQPVNVETPTAATENQPVVPAGTPVAI